MKKSKLKQIIREEYQNVTGNLLVEESIVTKLLYLFLSPKIKKDISKIKNSPEYIELERQAKLAAKELDAINKKLERSYTDLDTSIKSMQKAGIKVTKNMDSEQIYQAFKKWQSKESGNVGKPEWAKYFNE